MKYQKVIIFSLAFIIIGAALYYVISNRTSSPNTQQVNDSIQTETALSTQTLVDGTVTYIVTPKNFTPSSTTWDFDIGLDTHTGSLDQDLITLVRMVDDKGNEYKAIQWEGAAPGGHHREGVLKFLPITPRPIFIELKIQTTSNIEKNSLRWNI